MIKSILFFISLLFLTLYIPFTITAYSENFYEFNYKDYNIMQDIAKDSSSNLVSYFLYKESLDTELWSDKEIRHFDDVRDIYLLIHILAIIFFIISIFTINKKRTRYSTMFSIALLFDIAIFIFIASFFFDFTYFWNEVFHPLLFSNTDWIYTSSEISYYLFPENFFITSIIFIFVSTILINFFIFLSSFKQKI